MVEASKLHIHQTSYSDPYARIHPFETRLRHQLRSRSAAKMDQDAFRQLVSSSSAVGSSSSSSSTSKRAFGKAPKRAAPTSASSSSTTVSDLEPRKLHRSKQDDAYLDRAAARRSGVSSGEFSDVESLHRDFEARIAAASSEEERQTLRDQISSVGGDAKYSVLVKGLDWGLLAQNKAKLEREARGEGGQEDEGDDGGLEEAYEEGSKRSREDIVEAIRRRKEGKKAAGKGEAEKDSSRDGFKPIGFKPIAKVDSKEAEDEGAEYKWVNGKRMRKKKKKDSNAAEAAPSAADALQPQSSPSTPRGEATKMVERHAAPKSQNVPRSMQRPAQVDSLSPPRQEKSASAGVAPLGSAPTTTAVDPHRVDAQKPSTPALVPATAVEQGSDKADSDEEDIFADVGGWDGIADVNDEVDDEEDNIDTHAEKREEEEEGALESPVPPPSASNDVPLTVKRSPTPEAALPSPSASATSPALQLHGDSSTVKALKLEAHTVSQPLAPLDEPEPGQDGTTAAEMPQQATDPSRPAEPPSTVQDTPKTKPKKSKWDDDEDEKDKKRKKKKSKKHH